MKNNIPAEDKDYILNNKSNSQENAIAEVMHRSYRKYTEDIKPLTRMQHLAKQIETNHGISDFFESIFKIIIIIPQFAITFLILLIFIVADWKIFKILLKLESDFSKLSILMNDANSNYIIAFLILQLFLFSTRFGVKSTMQLLDKIKSIFSKNKITSPKPQ